MKILFYIEPHPVRQSFTQHRWLVDILNKEIPKNSDFKIISNHHIKSGPHHIPLTKEEQETIDSFFIKDEKLAMDDWKLLMEGKNKKYLDFYEKILNRIQNVYPYDVVLYWGTNHTIKYILDIPSIAMELGCTRNPHFKQTYYMDLNGVNGANSISSIPFDQIKNTSTNFNPSEMILDNTKYECCSFESGKKILLPLQLDDDTNIVLYSKYKSLKEFVFDTIERFKGTDYEIFVKPHPMHINRKYCKIKHEEIRDSIKNIPHVHWLDKMSTMEAIKLANVVIGINSSLLFESLLLEKVVIINGGCCWAMDGIYPTIEEIISNSFDYEEYKKKINKLTSFILQYYLIHGNIFNYSYLKEQVIQLTKTS